MVSKCIIVLQSTLSLCDVSFVYKVSKAKQL